MKRISCILLILGLLSSCASNKDISYENRDKTVSELYNEARTLLDSKQYNSAAKAFDEVERQYPYSIWAAKSQIMMAYAYYSALKYDDALLAIDRYIELHPAAEHVNYAYYLRALCYYEQINDVKRDQNITKLALYSLKDVVIRFPNSNYAKDAKLKIDLTNNNLAGQEMYIGRYYLKKGSYNAAINRFNGVVKNYDTTSHVEEALYRLVECYKSLGIDMEAIRMAAILGNNYPKSKWYKRAYDLLK